MKSFLDTDNYTFSVAQFILEHYPDAQVSYKFIDRKNTPLNNPDRFSQNLRKEIEKFHEITLRAEPEGIKFLQNLLYLKPWFITYLKNYKFNPEQVKFGITPDQKLWLDIEGPWAETIFWEVPLLAIISELYIEDGVLAGKIHGGLDRHLQNVKNDFSYLKGLNFVEFGTRRRRTFEYQDSVLDMLKKSSYDRMSPVKNFGGTSNTYLAMKHGLPVLGTQSHQIFSAVAALEGQERANEITLTKWAQTYNGMLGVALADTFGTPDCLKLFTQDAIFPCLYKGLRQDSGDPIAIAKLIVDHYKNNGIDLQGRTIYFSDGLTPKKCREIADHKDLKEINKIFAIGSYFTNDNPLNIVIKLRSCNGTPCVKLSDEPAKSFMG